MPYLSSINRLEGPSDRRSAVAVPRSAHSYGGKPISARNMASLRRASTRRLQASITVLAKTSDGVVEFVPTGGRLGESKHRACCPHSERSNSIGSHE
jgi:hypothetical protein